MCDNNTINNNNIAFQLKAQKCNNKYAASTNIETKIDTHKFKNNNYNDNDNSHV